MYKLTYRWGHPLFIVTMLGFIAASVAPGWLLKDHHEVWAKVQLEIPIWMLVGGWLVLSVGATLFFKAARVQQIKIGVTILSMMAILAALSNMFSSDPWWLISDGVVRVDTIQLAAAVLGGFVTCLALCSVQQEDSTVLHKHGHRATGDEPVAAEPQAEQALATGEMQIPQLVPTPAVPPAQPIPPGEAESGESAPKTTRESRVPATSTVTGLKAMSSGLGGSGLAARAAASGSATNLKGLLDKLDPDVKLTIPPDSGVVENATAPASTASASPKATPTSAFAEASPVKSDASVQSTAEVVNPTPTNPTSTAANLPEQKKPPASTTATRLQAQKRKSTATFTKLQALSAGGGGGTSAPRPKQPDSDQESDSLKSILDRLDTQPFDDEPVNDILSPSESLLTPPEVAEANRMSPPPSKQPEPPKTGAAKEKAAEPNKSQPAKKESPKTPEPSKKSEPAKPAAAKLEPPKTPVKPEQMKADANKQAPAAKKSETAAPPKMVHIPNDDETNLSAMLDNMESLLPESTDFSPPSASESPAALDSASGYTKDDLLSIPTPKAKPGLRELASKEANKSKSSLIKGKSDASKSDSEAEPTKTEQEEAKAESEKSATAEAKTEPEKSETAEAKTESAKSETAEAKIESEKSETAEARTESAKSETAEAKIESEKSETVEATAEPAKFESAEAKIESEQSETAEATAEPAKSESAEAKIESEKSETAEAKTEPAKSESAEAKTEPEKSETPEATAEPAKSESAEATAEPAKSESAEATAEPAKSESAEATAEPAKSESAEATAEPAKSESAEATAEPAKSESAEATAEPAKSESAEATAEPAKSETAEATAEPAKSETAEAKTESEKPETGEAKTESEKPETGEAKTEPTKFESADAKSEQAQSETPEAKASIEKAQAEPTEDRKKEEPAKGSIADAFAPEPANDEESALIAEAANILAHHEKTEAVAPEAKAEPAESKTETAAPEAMTETSTEPAEAKRETTTESKAEETAPEAKVEAPEQKAEPAETKPVAEEKLETATIEAKVEVAEPKPETTVSEAKPEPAASEATKPAAEAVPVEAEAKAESKPEVDRQPVEAASKVEAAPPAMQDNLFGGKVDQDIDDIFSSIAPADAQKEVGSKAAEEPAVAETAVSDSFIEIERTDTPPDASDNVFGQAIDKDIDDIFSNIVPVEAQKEVKDTAYQKPYGADSKSDEPAAAATASAKEPEVEAKPGQPEPVSPAAETKQPEPATTEAKPTPVAAKSAAEIAAALKAQADTIPPVEPVAADNKLFEPQKVEKDLDDIFSNIAPEEAHQTVSDETLAKLKGTEEGEMSFEPGLSREEKIAQAAKQQPLTTKFNETLARLPSMQGTVEGLLNNLADMADTDFKPESKKPDEADRALKPESKDAPTSKAVATSSVLNLLDSLEQENKEHAAQASSDSVTEPVAAEQAPSSTAPTMQSESESESLTSAFEAAQNAQAASTPQQSVSASNAGEPVTSTAAEAYSEGIKVKAEEEAARQKADAEADEQSEEGELQEGDIPLSMRSTVDIATALKDAQKAKQMAAVEKQLKEFGRLSTKAPTPSNEPPGSMKTIGKLLVEVSQIENIIKAGESGKIGGNLTTARVISAARGAGIKELLNKIDSYSGVKGSVIVGHDGLVIASTVGEDMDKDALGALSLHCLGSSNMATQKLEIGKLRQMVLISGEKITVLTDVDVGILAVFMDNVRVDRIDGLITAIHDTIHG